MNEDILNNQENNENNENNEKNYENKKIVSFSDVLEDGTIIESYGYLINIDDNKEYISDEDFEEFKKILENNKKR